MAVTHFWRAIIVCVGIFLLITTSVMIGLVEDGLLDAPAPIKTIAHYIILAISPIVPFIAPIQFGVFLKAWKHESWPQKKLWMFISGAWAFNMLVKVYGDAAELYEGRTKCGGVKLCGLEKCTAAWTEEIAFLAVVLCNWMGWKWDGGLVDKWIEGIIKADAEQRRKKEMANIENAEKGIVKEAIESTKEVFVDEKLVEEST